MAESLFNKRLLSQSIESFSFPAGEQLKNIKEILSGWQSAISHGKKLKETELESAFFTRFFEDILGYTVRTSGKDIYTMRLKPKTEVDATFPDGTLGFFGDEEEFTRVVIELKSPGTSLDAKEAGREVKLTPVEQAFRYVNKFDRCDWAIVSNFNEIRLYNKERGIGFYDRFEIARLGQNDEFRRFYYCLSAANLLDRNRKSILDSLVQNTARNEREISRRLYEDYKALRLNLFRHIKEENSHIDTLLLLEKTQKLLDRMVFVFFCQHTGNLLPHDIVSRTYRTALSSRSRENQKVWSEFKYLFEDIDKGRDDLHPQINAYNGGLFEPDPQLDALVIKNGIWDEIVGLGKYDFESDLNVNILGHIFERSIKDIEEIKAEISGIGILRSKRKRDGIYYTPEYITRYIVTETVGRYLEENPDRLESIRILDPACGSGAFLNQAHTFLRQQYQVGFDSGTIKSKDAHIGGLFDYNPAENDRAILLDNLYGVDLNEESVQITRLALWLKTARRDYQLQDLSDNIKCGNALVATGAFEKRPFVWEEEFKDIMDEGGFDVIVGNPPYYNIETLGLGAPVFEYLKESYADIYMDKSDILIYFIKRAIDLLKPAGIMGFIVSNAFLFSSQAAKLRDFILENSTVLEIVNFERHYVFEDADVTTCILILQKGASARPSRVISFKEAAYPDNFIVSHIEDKANFFDASFRLQSPFALVNSRIESVHEKIDGSHKQIGEIFHIGSGMQTAANKVYVLKEVPDDFPPELVRRRMSGDIIERYYVHPAKEHILYIEDVEEFEDLPESIQNYLNANRSDLLKRADKKRRKTAIWWKFSFALHKDFYRHDKIWSSYRSSSNKFVYDNSNDFVGLTNTTVIFGNNPEYDLKYVLALLNSRLLNFRYRAIGKQTGSGIFEYFENQISRLPIPEATKQQQADFAKKADEIIAKEKALRSYINKKLDFLKARLNVENLSQKLEGFYLLTASQLLVEIKKHSTFATIKEEQEVFTWLESIRSEIARKRDQINAKDAEMDRAVYDLYKLTEDDIKIIESDT